MNLKINNISILFLIAASIVMSCFAQDKNISDSKHTREEILKIIDEISKTHKFTIENRRYILKSVDEDDLGCRHMGILALSVASELGLYSQQELLMRLEKSAVHSKGSEPELYIVEYARVLGFGKPVGKDWYSKYQIVKSKNRNFKIINDVERKFCSNVLSSMNISESQLAGRLFVNKISMNQDSSNWVNGKIVKQIRSTKNKQKEYWECIHRVVTARNPKK